MVGSVGLDRPRSRDVSTGSRFRPWRGLRAAGAPVLLAQLMGCSDLGILNPAGPIAAANRMIMLNALAIMLAIVIPTIIGTLAFAWWFRASNTRARYLPDFTYSGRIELIVWSIPILVILFLGGVIWVGSHDLDPRRPIASSTPPLDVQVVSLDWKWLFVYPDQGIASVNELVVPAGTPIRFTLTSSSVMNVFFVPQLGSMIYTMNRMETELHLQADQPGTYRGQSSHFSGDGFSDMAFTVRAVAQGEFDGWLAGVRGAGPDLDAAGYGELARQSQDVKPHTYRNVLPGLFEDIVSQKLAPGPGPQVDRAGSHGSPHTEN
ncbi:MAG: ubiquinol oxidase subunit II [Microvirga sp.]